MTMQVASRRRQQRWIVTAALRRCASRHAPWIVAAARRLVARRATARSSCGSKDSGMFDLTGPGKNAPPLPDHSAPLPFSKICLEIVGQKLTFTFADWGRFWTGSTANGALPWLPQIPVFWYNALAQYGTVAGGPEQYGLRGGEHRRWRADVCGQPDAGHGSSGVCESWGLGPFKKKKFECKHFEPVVRKQTCR